MDVGLKKGVQKLWKQESLVDYTIVVEEREFKVHKLVLASVSDYFEAMICGSLKESETDRVELKGLSADAISKLLELIYTGQWEIITQNTFDILECAVYFQMPEVISECKRILLRGLDTKNCLTLLSTFSVYSLHDEVQKVKDFLRNNKKTVIDKCKPEEMPQEGLEIISECWDKAEWDLFLLIKYWVNLDCENRRVHLNDLMSQVRFCLIEPGKIAAIKEMDVFTDSDGSWCQLVEKAEEYHKQEIHLKVLDISVQSTVRAEAAPVLIDKELSGRRVHTEMYSLGSGNKWLNRTIPEGPDFHRASPVAVVVNNFMILCTEHNKVQQWHIFDPRSTTWSEMPGMTTPRVNFALVHHQDKLYTLGGNIIELHTPRVQALSDGIEVYNLKTNTWSTYNNMPRAVAQHSACVYDNHIYVSGGHTEKSYSGTVNLDCLDLGTGTWEKKSPMSKKLESHTMHVIKEYSGGVIIALAQNMKVTKYNPGSNQWSDYELSFQSKWTHDYELCAESVVLGSANGLFLFNMGGMRISDKMRRRRNRASNRESCRCRDCNEYDSDEDIDDDDGYYYCTNRRCSDDSDGCECESCLNLTDESSYYECRLCRKWNLESYQGTETELTLPLPGNEEEAADRFCAALLAVPPADCTL